MSNFTKSEALFDQICSERNLRAVRHPVSNITGVKTPDFGLHLDGLEVAVEVKQLDPTNEDKLMIATRNRRECVTTIAPTSRVRNKIGESLAQFKASAKAGRPCMLCLYDNTENFQFIDTFTVMGTMYGDFAVGLDLGRDGIWREAAQGFHRNRKPTRNRCTRISAVAVLDWRGYYELTFTVYHNVFASNPIRPGLLRDLADRQYIHDSPHSGQFVALHPREIILPAIAQSIGPTLAEYRSKK